MLMRCHQVPTLFQIPLHKSDIFTLPTLDLDESTLEGNADIIEELITQIGAKLEEMIETSIPLSGDQMTVVRARAVQTLRIRDCAEHRAAYPYPWSGFLHYGFAAADAVRRANMGGRDGKDPASFTRFATHLGRTRVLEKGGDYNATHRLIIQVMEGHILAALMEVSKSTSLEELMAKSRTDNWMAWIDQVSAEYFPLIKVGFLRSNATIGALTEWQAQADPIRAICVADRTEQQKAFLKGKDKWIKSRALEKRDIAYENCLLYMQHSIIYADFHSAMRQGDTGRLEKSYEFFVVLFEGIGKSNYAREVLEQQVDRKALWKPYMRTIWLLNCLLNISGRPDKFLGVDEVNEYIVKELKFSYNPRST